MLPLLLLLQGPDYASTTPLHGTILKLLDSVSGSVVATASNQLDVPCTPGQVGVSSGSWIMGQVGPGRMVAALTGRGRLP